MRTRSRRLTSISNAIEHSLARSRALLAFYSAAYRRPVRPKASGSRSGRRRLRAAPPTSPASVTPTVASVPRSSNSGDAERLRIAVCGVRRDLVLQVPHSCPRRDLRRRAGVTQQPQRGQGRGW